MHEESLHDEGGVHVHAEGAHEGERDEEGVDPGQVLLGLVVDVVEVEHGLKETIGVSWAVLLLPSEIVHFFGFIVIENKHVLN